MIVAGTGHRPDKLGGYSTQAETRLVLFAVSVLGEITPSEVISGMALGWDMALAEAAYLLGIPYRAYIPFQGQERKWPRESQALYRNLLVHAQDIVVCSEGGYAPYKMHVRNHRMVDDCNQVLALYNGTPGGTAECIAYAEKVGRPVENFWDTWNDRT